MNGDQSKRDVSLPPDATPRAGSPCHDAPRAGRPCHVSWAAVPVWVIVLGCCIAPLVWIVAQVSLRPEVIRQLRPSPFSLGLLGRTVLYNVGVAGVACAMSIPAAVAIGRGRGRLARALVLVLPVCLVLPSVAYSYGWLQFFRLIRISFAPAGGADVLRCMWTLACWLWPIPAVAVGLSLRHLDSQIQQQAMLDGALWRITARMLLGPMLASGAVVLVLAMEEFSVYERSGISVVATEVRTIFETGAGSYNNPAAIAGVAAGAGLDDPRQAQRAAAAIATALPLLGIVAILAVAAFAYAARLSASQRLDGGSWPRRLDAGRIWTRLAWTTVAVGAGIPTVSMLVSISPHRWLVDSQGHWFATRIWLWAQPYVEGTLVYGIFSAAVAMALAVLATVRRSRWMFAAAFAAFLIGGELLAIAHIRVYHRSPIPKSARMVMAYVGRFGWLALLAGNLTWTRGLREIRDMAAVDGASRWRTAIHVILPIAWPILLAGAVLVMVLSMTEVSATVLLTPSSPQPLILTLMSWVHNQRYDVMLEGALLLMAIVMVLGVGLMLLISLGIRLGARAGRLLAIIAVFVSLAGGCDDRSVPRAVWCETGTGPGRLVYPRGIAYSRRDDCFFVVDRTARIQRLDSGGKPLLEWRMPEWQQGKPVGLAAGPDGNVYVADTHYSRVMVYSPVGKLLRQWGSLGRGPGQFIYPTHVAFDSARNIYVSEYGDNDRIQVFDPTASRVLRTIGRFGQGDGEFSRPEMMVIDGETLYVTDSSNHRIAVFRTDGAFVRNIGGVGRAPGQFRFPYGLVMDEAGRLVVTEYGNNRVQLIDKQTGRGIATWGSAGDAPGQLAYPWASAIDRRGRVVVVDSGNNRLQVFEW